MPQKLPASRPASRSSTDARRLALPPVQLLDAINQVGISDDTLREKTPSIISPLASQHSQVSARKFEQPPPSASRNLGVQSMLNPTNQEGRQIVGHRPVEDTNQSSPNTVPGNSLTSRRQFLSHHLSLSTLPPPDAQDNNHLRTPCQIPTPRSPSRSISTGVISTPSGIDSKQNSITGGNSLYRSQHSLSKPSEPLSILPAPGAIQKPISQSYDYSPATSTASISLQATKKMNSGGVISSKDSQNCHKSSESNHQKIGQASGYNSYYFTRSNIGNLVQPAGGMQMQGPSGNTEGPYNAPVAQSQGSPLDPGSAGSSRKTSASDPIKVLTITTTQGLYTVPVDVHHASRLADEKRARNAGASARFRQRRKEKEKEANSAIEKLQAQVRDLEKSLKELQSECDFYHSERDRLRDIVFRIPEKRHLTMQAPPSPNSGRALSLLGQIGMRIPPPPISYPEEFLERASRRRRSHTDGSFTDVAQTKPPISPTATLPSGHQVMEISQPSQQLGSQTSFPAQADRNLPQIPIPENNPISLNSDPCTQQTHQRNWSGNAGSR
ncbi:unnamed protein product [Blumeria hordei]|uniref:BZIP domain-containing protein n=1 Tax=Blumeria hordei TaxID=2867405 RepID=A0A383UPG3_BLUHO|nr:unnamed protein product [Blumeria hordei]